MRSGLNEQVGTLIYSILNAAVLECIKHLFFSALAGVFIAYLAIK